jgi:hypothetical protein
MSKALLRMIVIVPAVLVILAAGVATAPAATTQLLWCHNTNFPSCGGILNVAGNSVSYTMTGTPSLAMVDGFTDPGTTRNVTWSNLNMNGTTGTGDPISATLDTSRQSSGTILSVGNTEFPATATMRFFFRMDAAGMSLISDRPAVFQGIIHSVPPSPGDSLTLISGPVDFHPDGASSPVITLKAATVNFNDPNAAPKSASAPSH